MHHLLIPPVLWVALLTLMIVTRDLTQLGTVFDAPADMAGWAIIAAGFGIQIGAAGQFVKARTNLHAFRNPDLLVTDGLFALSRNPMYLGFVLTLTGAALMVNTLPAFIGPVLFFAIAHIWYIPREERIAEQLFGDAYRRYRAKVRRWI